MKLSTEIQSRIETLALFIGYPRSGHTLIGSLLDAHPHIVIANELDIFQRWTEWTEAEKTRENLINKMYENSFRQAQGIGYRSAERNGRTYAVPNQWQGKYKDYIKVSCSVDNTAPYKLGGHVWDLTMCPQKGDVCLIQRIKPLFHLSQKPTCKSTESAFKYCDWMNVLAASLRVEFCDEWKKAFNVRTRDLCPLKRNVRLRERFDCTNGQWK